MSPPAGRMALSSPRGQVGSHFVRETQGLGQLVFKLLGIFGVPQLGGLVGVRVWPGKAVSHHFSALVRICSHDTVWTQAPALGHARESKSPVKLSS